MPISRDIIPIYDEPPVARYPSSHRMPTVQYATDGSNNGNGTNTLGSRRRSWQDLVAESDTATVSDISVTNYSLGEGSMGNRRQSWMNLMDSDENLHKTAASEKVSRNPSGPQPSKPGMRIVTVSDSGRLQKENSPNQKSKNNSIASTPSEFILVPKSYSSAGSLPRKTEEPPGKVRNFGISLKNRRKNGQSDPSDPYICPCSAKKTLFFICLATILIAVAATIGIVVRQNMKWPKVYQLKWRGGSTGQGVVRLALSVRNEKHAVFNVVGWPFSTAKTFVDFEKKRVVAIDPALSDYCFAMYLNTTALSDARALIKAADNALETELNREEWPEDWHWIPEILPDQFREDVLSSNAGDQCKEGNGLLWLRHYFDDQRNNKCNDCQQVCLPMYGIENERLKILRRQCFWLYMPEWNKYSNENQLSNNQKFNRYYESRTTKYPNSGRNGAGWLSVNNNGAAGRPLRGQPGTTAPPNAFVGNNNNNYYNNNNNVVSRNDNDDDNNGWLPVGISNS